MAVYEHLELVREVPTPKRRKHGFGDISPPDDPAEHARDLKSGLEGSRSWQERPENQVGGFDDRYIFRFETDGNVDPELYEAIEGVEFVSQEDDGLVIVFADERGMSIFEDRLEELVRGEMPTRKELLYALQSANNVRPEDRMGSALRAEEFPSDEPFLLDVELWPVSNFQQIANAFSDWLADEGIREVDRVRNQPQLVLFRVKVTEAEAEKLLKHRDVRWADLPARVGIERGITSLDLKDLPDVNEPADDVPCVAVLDSGVAQNHPLLAPALGDAQSFLSSTNDPSDQSGHGTMVCGIATWGRVEDLLGLQRATPLVRLLSGRLLDANGEYDDSLIENQIREAVEYFHDNYGCRVFNVSLGHMDRVYDGKHLRGLAVTLDDLSREYDVLFVVPTGNFPGREPHPLNWRSAYPEHFFEHETGILDPATALHVLTVGSLAENEQTYVEAQHQSSIDELPIARLKEPSPFSRTGPTVAGALKPEILAHGGNWAVTRMGRISSRGIGRLSTNHDFAKRGRLLSVDEGTSYAAPHIAHYAARLFGEFPDASQNLIRALLLANSSVPEESEALLGRGEPKKAENRERIHRVCGYGELDVDTLFRSTDEEVVMYVDSSVEIDGVHIYEVPIPDDYYEGGRRDRKVTVGFAYTSQTRTTRLDYLKTRMDFRLIEAKTVDEAAAANDAETEKEDYERIDELLSSKNRTHRSTDRQYATAQACTWTIRAKHKSRLENQMFVVVTRKDRPWAENRVDEERPYALVVRVQNRGGEPIYQQMKATLQAKQRARQRS